MAANPFDQFDQQSVNPFDQFDTKVSTPSKARTFGEAAKDIAAGVVSGAGSLVQLPGQLYGLATGDLSETGALGLGKDIAKYGEEMKSAGLKAREAERAEKIKTAEQTGQWEAFKTAFGETIKDPALLTSFLAEQAPQLLVPFGAAKVAQIGTAAKAAAAAQGLTGEAATKAIGEITKAAAERGTRAAIGAGAVQQGADVGAQAYEDIYKELKRKGASDPDAAQGAINLARAAGASGAVISVLAQRLPGARTLEESFAGVPGTGGRLLGAAKGALGEGLSEVVEETGGKLGANLAMREVKPEQSLLEGLGQTAGMAAVGGVGMGGVSGLARRPAAEEVKPAEAPPTEEKPLALEYKPETLVVFPDGSVGTRQDVENYINSLPEDQRIQARARLLGMGESPSTPVKEGAPLTEDEISQLDQQLMAGAPRPSAEDVLQEVRGKIQTAPSTTPADVARVRDEHETAVINSLLEQDKKMQSVSDLARLNLERMSQTESMEAATQDADRRVREGRLMARVQSLIDQNIPFASTAIADINRKFEMIGEAPLDDNERSRVQNIMTMAQGFTDFVKLPSLPVREQDRFAENQAMQELESSYKEQLQKRLQQEADRQAQLSNKKKQATTQAVLQSIQKRGGIASIDEAEYLQSQGIEGAFVDVDPGLGETISVTSKGMEEEISPEEMSYRLAQLKERKPRGQVSPQPVRAETPAPSPVVGQAPVSGRVEEGAAVRPEAGIEPSIAEDRERAEPVAAPTAEPVKRIGASGMGQRMVNAANRFRDSAVEQFGLTPEQADRAMGRLMKEKVLSLDPVTGQYKLKDGRFWDREVLLRAAGEAAPESITEPERAEEAKPVELAAVQPEEKQTELAEAPDTLTDEEFDQYEREQTQEAISRLSSGDYAAPRPATFIRPGMRSKVDEAMDRAKQNAYKKAVREFLQAPLTAKPPTGKSEGIDYSIYDAVDGLTDVEPQRIETKAPVAKSFQNKLEVLFKYVVPSKDIRYYLTRVMLDPEKSRMVATDGKSLVIVEDESVKQNAPERPLGVTRDKAILVNKDGTWATSDDGRPMEAIYPDVDRVIPKTDRTVAVSYNTDDFVAYAKGVEKSNKFVKTDLPLVIQIFNKQNAFDVERLVSLGEVFRRLGYKNFVVTLPNDPLDGRLMATSPDGKVKQIVMSVKYGETTGEIKRRFYKPYEPVAPKKSLRAGKAQQLSDFEQTLRTALNRFGLKDIGLKLIDGMREEGSYAQQLIRIAADSANPIRTLRHEAIHALRELGFFTPQQWQSLSKMAKDKWIDQYLKQRNVDGKPLKAGEESRYDAYMREYNGDMEKITEEAVADAFADFDATKPPAGLMQSLLTRLRNLFQAIKSALTKVESPEQIFGKVERGELAAGAAETKGEAKSLRDRATANFLRWFGDSKVVDEKGEPLVVYHGTRASFDKFELSKAFQDEYGQGFYFTEYPDVASKYAERESGNVMPVYLSIKNPAIVRGAFADGDLYKLAGAERRSQLTERLIAKGYDGVIREQRGGKLEIVAFRPEQIKSAIGNNGEYSLTDADIRKSLRKEEPKPTPTTAGQQALDTINQLGMGVKEPEPNLREKVKKKLERIGEAPTKESMKQWKTAMSDFFAKLDGLLFSADAPFENKIRQGKREDFKSVEEFMGTMLAVSQSQAVGPDAVATQAMLIGKPEYRKDLYKWVAVKDEANEVNKAKILDGIAKKYGLTKEEAIRVAHTYLSAANYAGILERNAANKESKDKVREKARKLDAEIVKLNAEYQKRMDEQREQAETEISKLQGKIRELKAEGDRDSEIADLKDRIEELRKEREPGKLITQLKKEIKALREEHAEQTKEIERLGAADVYVSPEQAAMVEPGLAIANQIPEVKQITELWNKQRENVKNVLVETGLWTPEYADAMMDNAAYVPFYREMEDEADASPEMMMRGLQVKAKEHKLKGSAAPVADVFENMAKWQQYAINRAIRNHKAVQMINVAKEMKMGDEPMAKEVSEAKRGKNVVRVWEGGKQKFYEMSDPLFIDAFKSLGAVSIPTIKYFTAIADLLRRSIVMYPMFSVGQVPQDAVAAIFASGLQPKYAFKIPFYAVKEAIQTYRGMSKIHDELKNFGAVGVRDFNSATMRQDAEITAGLKIPRGGVEKVKFVLERIAMSADNAVRQAVYQAAMEQPGVTQAEALEKAFEIINFRRRGSSKMVNLIGQTVPFFYAYLSAQRVAYKTLTGIGISPTERKAALETLAYTSAAVMALSFIYAMANGDDEDYEKVPSNVRDRSIVIPGTGGLRIPLRPDFFLFPKIIAEHTYHLMAENGFSDPAKFKRAMRDNFVNSATSPNVVPQIIKPAFEIGINYDFFQGKPIIGFFEQNKDASRQFNDSTSEFAKFMGGAGLSPQKVDHFIRGYFGTVGGLFLWTTNFMMEGEPGVPRPELSWHDVAATMPGVGAFKQKSTENALKVDFYELRDAVEKAKNTYDDIKKRSPEGLRAFVENEENYAKLALEKKVTHVAEHLSKIRKAIQQVSAAPEGRYTAEEKQERIKDLRDLELRYLKAIDLKGMREKAMM